MDDSFYLQEGVLIIPESISPSLDDLDLIVDSVDDDGVDSSSSVRQDAGEVGVLPVSQTLLSSFRGLNVLTLYILNVRIYYAL